MSEADQLVVLDQFNQAWNGHDLEAAPARIP
jgi:hypothetical protein